MKNIKHTQAYAEKLASEFKDDDRLKSLNILPNSFERSMFIEGYMKAIEETNVTELISALQDAQSLIEKHFPNDLTILDKINNSLTKSTV